MHAEPVLLVDHRKAEITEHNIILKQRMGADGNVDLARSQLLAQRCPLRCTVAPREQCDGAGPACSASGFMRS